jgi:glyoxylase-like metal-dependent hydrolase (beta-lactamase superfamily II)
MKPFLVRLSVTNVYLLACKGGYLQIDTGYTHDYERYRQALRDLGLDVAQVKFLLLTHHHDDHAGFLNDLCRDTDLTIIAHREAEALLKGGSNDTSHGGGYVSRRVEFLAGLKRRFDRRWTLRFPSFDLRPQDVRLVADNDSLLRNLGIAGRIVTTPGHCIDHLSLVLDNGNTFAGDAASSFLLFAGTHYATLFMTDMESAYRSWQKLLDARARTIYPAHGRPFAADKLHENMGRIRTENLVSFF